MAGHLVARTAAMTAESWGRMSAGQLADMKALKTVVMLVEWMVVLKVAHWDSSKVGMLAQTTAEKRVASTEKS